MKLGYEFVDIDELLNKKILKNVENFDFNTLSKLEIESLEQILSKPNTVFYISADIILANNNMQFIYNSEVFYLQYSERMFDEISKNRIEKDSFSEINNFFSKNIKRTIFVDNCSINQVISKIFDFLR